MARLKISKRLWDKLSPTIDVKVATAKDVTTRVQMWLSGFYFDQTNNGYELEVFPPSWGNCFDVRKGEISYHAGEQGLNAEGKWAREGRQICKASRLVAHLIDTFGVIIEGEWHQADKPKLIQRFLELVSLTASCKGGDIQVSDDAECIYAIPNAIESIGTLNNSCMRSDSDWGCHRQSGFYNAMGSSIAYCINSDGKLIARAVLWHNVRKQSDDTEFSYIDRIYGTEDSIANFKEWAHENGYAHKVEQSYSNSQLVFADGSRIQSYYISKQAEWKRGFPFMDSLCYLQYKNDSVIRLSTQQPSRGYYYKIQNTDGEIPRREGDRDDSDDDDGCGESNVVECCSCGHEIDEDDSRNEIHGRIYCEECSRWSEHEDRYIREENAVYSEHLDDYLSSSCSVEVQTGRNSYDYMPDSWEGIIEVGDNYYYNDSDLIGYCEICDEYSLIDDIGYWDQLDRSVCDNCLEEAMHDRDYYYIDGEWVKATYCQVCEEYHPEDDVQYYEELEQDVCDDCLEEAMHNKGYYCIDDEWVKATFCDVCKEYHPEDEVKFYDQLGQNVCDDCLDTAMDSAGYYYFDGNWLKSEPEPVS